MIAVIKAGGANLASVTNALARLKCDYTLTSDANVISSASHVIFPGVGHAAHAMNELESAGLIECIQSLKQPVLGICLGMQLFYEGSDEGETRCLGILPGTIIKMKPKPGYTIPHMGWNQLRKVGRLSPLLEGVSAESHVYFVHSYRAPMNAYVRSVADYDQEIPAMVQKDNYYGVQFHPERSGEVGENILRSFLKL